MRPSAPDLRSVPSVSDGKTRSPTSPTEESHTSGSGARITRRCPGCGAAIEHGEDDGAVGCDFCGARLAIGAGAENPAYAIAVGRASGQECPPREGRAGGVAGSSPGDRERGADGAVEQWITEAKRALRTAGLRVRAIEPPRALLVPFHRLRAHTWQWFRTAPRIEGMDTEPPPLAPVDDEGEGRFRLGVWDATIDAVPSLGLGPRTLGFRTQVLAWTPLADFLSSGHHRGPDHAVLPAELGAIDAREQLAQRLSASCQLPPETASEQWTLVTDAAQQLMHAPILLCPFVGPQGRAAVILDGITFRAGRVLAGDELSRLEALERAARARGAGARSAVQQGDVAQVGGVPAQRAAPFAGAGTLIPLSCPECSSPLPFLPRARVHRCTICGRHWTVGGDTLAPVRGVALVAAAAGRPQTHTVFLPFHRLRGGGGEEWFVPASRGRNPRAAWNFALGLARRRRSWEEADLADDAGAAAAVNRSRLTVPGGEQPPTGGRAFQAPGIEMTPPTAAALAPFLARCLETAVPTTLETELAWIAFTPKGPDLVEPGSGLGLPRLALTPWSAPAPHPRPAAAVSTA